MADRRAPGASLFLDVAIGGSRTMKDGLMRPGAVEELDGSDYSQ